MKTYGKCNYEYCRFNKGKQCTSKQHREQCVKLANLVLAKITIKRFK